MFPFVLFGVVLYFGVRTVLERECAEQLHQQPTKAGPTAGPIDSSSPQLPEPVSAPPGWPADINFVECEKLMATLPKEQVRIFVQQMGTISDAEWSARKAKMISMGQSKLADCLEGTRQLLKVMPEFGV